MELRYRQHARRGRILLAAALGLPLGAQPADDLPLPPGAVVIEHAAVPYSAHPARELVLWMLSPERHDRGEFSESDPYTCPERTLGSYYSGPTRVSLVDTLARKLINTITLRHGWDQQDSFDIPYRILAGFYYPVPGKANGSEGKPVLLTLRDINGDGLPLETVFFEAEACMGLLTTSVGYSVRQDRVIQYEVELSVSTQEVVKGRGIAQRGQTTTKTSTWIDYLFAEQPNEPGQWSYKIDYTGRGGSLDSYAVRYDLSREKYFGTLRRLIPPF